MITSTAIATQTDALFLLPSSFIISSFFLLSSFRSAVWGGQVKGKFMDARTAFIGFLASKGIEESMATTGVDMLFYSVTTFLLFLVSLIAFPAVFTGEPDVLLKMCEPYGKKPDMNKFNALIKAGAPIRTTVRTKDVGVT